LLAMLDYDLPVVLVDMPAASITALAKFDAEVGFFDELQRSGYRPTMVNVLSPFQSSTRTVQQMVDLAGKSADYVAVVNRWFGDDEDFYMWFGDGNGNPPSRGRAMLPDYGGEEIDLPKLQAGVMVAIDDRMMRFADAAADGSPLSRAQRSRLIRWMKDTDAQLDKVADKIGLGAGK
ncbi:MAG: cobalamin biosynthesis protein CobQ, partial [Thiomonas sp. 15-63-373]